MAPRRVLHALAAHIAHALEMDVSAPDIAAELGTKDVRVLLGRAIPDAHPRLFGMLDRVGERAVPLAFYRRLNRLLSGPASAAVLEHERIGEVCLRVAEALAREPVLLAARRAIGQSEHNLHQFRSVLAFLRATGLARDIEQVPHGAGWHSVVRRLTADLGRAVAPPLPFRCPPGWQHVAVLSDLFGLGKKLGNCVSGVGGGGTHHLLHFVDGEEVFFVSDGEQTALASVQNVGPRLWVIAQLAIRRHQPSLSPMVGNLRVALSEVLADAGHVLLEVAPISAFQSTAWSAESSAAQDADDLDVAA